VLLVGPFPGLTTPLAAGQILWINMLTHGVRGVAFGGEPLDPALMRRPSPPAGARRMDEQVQACVFLTLGLAQLGVALALRASRLGLDLAARGLELAVLVPAALQVLPVLWEPAGELLQLRPISATAFVVALLLGALPGAVLGVLRRISRPTGFTGEG